MPESLAVGPAERREPPPLGGFVLLLLCKRSSPVTWGCSETPVGSQEFQTGET